MRWFRLVPLALLALGIAGSAAAADQSLPCRPSFIVPYSEQCDFAHGSIRKDRSAANVQNAFTTCDRAQDAAGNCLSSKVKQVHVLALSALYRAVSEQADIALFAGQFATGEALLKEELSILDIAAREAKPGDESVAKERTAAKADLASAVSGECSERAYLASAPARTFAHDRRYRDLEKALVGESSQYAHCATLATTQAKRAYIEYVSYVAIEEAGRAAQALNDKEDAGKLYAVCLSGTGRSLAYADDATKKYLGVLTLLCKGRMDGTYRVDQPRPIDQEAGGFRPLELPH